MTKEFDYSDKTVGLRVVNNQDSASEEKTGNLSSIHYLEGYCFVSGEEMKIAFFDRLHDYSKALRLLEGIVKHLEAPETGGMEKNQKYISWGNTSLETLKKEFKLFEAIFKF